ncbi:MAG: endoglucanase [Alphaproteobacteria bacterium]|nr:endoglucanase [Alphaproteobacteria bacterium]
MLVLVAASPVPARADDAAPSPPTATAPPATVAEQWAVYRGRFVTDDGRVVDTGNKEVSHTEGQGWAMLLAQAAGDRASFTRIWDWTRSKLQRHDALFSWRYDPNDEKKPVSDTNDASDGDILIAWALIRAGRTWDEPDYTREARRILSDIRRRLIVRAPGRTVLLPGLSGFKGKDGVSLINPSYYIYPALADFNAVLPGPEWGRLRQAGLNLLSDARFGRWGLTPDWVNIGRDGDLSVATKFPPRFGFEAIRVPLYLIWAGEATPPRLASYLDFWNDYGGKPAPAWTDLKDNSVAPYAGPTGFRAITELARAVGGTAPATLPTIGDKDDYYSASLALLAAVAQGEIPRQAH